MRLEIDKLYVVTLLYPCTCPLALGDHCLYYRGVFTNKSGAVMLRFSTTLDVDAVFYNLLIHNFFTVHEII